MHPISAEQKIKALPRSAALIALDDSLTEKYLDFKTSQTYSIKRT